MTGRRCTRTSPAAACRCQRIRSKRSATGSTLPPRRRPNPPAARRATRANGAMSPRGHDATCRAGPSGISGRGSSSRMAQGRAHPWPPLADAWDRASWCGPGRLSPKRADGSFSIRPDQPADYRLLMRELSARGLAPARVVHLWSLDADGQDFDTAQRLGFYSLLHFVRALETDSHVEIVGVTRGAQSVHDVGELRHPEQATLRGACISIAQENPSIRCRSVDIDEISSRLLLEEDSVDSGDLEVAYRNGQRYVLAYAARHLGRPTGAGVSRGRHVPVDRRLRRGRRDCRRASGTRQPSQPGARRTLGAHARARRAGAPLAGCRCDGVWQRRQMQPTRRHCVR